MEEETFDTRTESNDDNREDAIVLEAGKSPRRISDDIVLSFRRNTAVTLTALILSFAGCFASCCLTLKYLDSTHHRVYIIDEGAAFAAHIGDDRSLSMELEIEDHVGRFHEHLFSLSPSKRAIEESLEAAYRMSDRSVYDYAEKGYYSRMVSANISQQIIVDSVRTETGKKPYMVRTYSRLFVLRESSAAEYSIQSTCEVVPVNRSSDNPHGLMIEKFRVVSQELSSSVRR